MPFADYAMMLSLRAATPRCRFHDVTPMFTLTPPPLSASFTMPFYFILFTIITLIYIAAFLFIYFRYFIFFMPMLFRHVTASAATLSDESCHAPFRLFFAPFSERFSPPRFLRFDAIYFALIAAYDATLYFERFMLFSSSFRLRHYFSSAAIFDYFRHAIFAALCLPCRRLL